MLPVAPNLCLTDTQVYILAMETLAEKAYGKKRNREADKVLLTAISMLIKECLFCLNLAIRLLQLMYEHIFSKISKQS